MSNLSSSNKTFNVYEHEPKGRFVYYMCDGIFENLLTEWRNVETDSILLEDTVRHSPALKI